jgi:hypothetical protein
MQNVILPQDMNVIRCLFAPVAVIIFGLLLNMVNESIPRDMGNTEPAPDPPRLVALTVLVLVIIITWSVCMNRMSMREKAESAAHLTAAEQFVNP